MTRIIPGKHLAPGDLLAAAPDLYEACKAVNPYYEPKHGAGPGGCGK